jgi:hypothetical protein
MSLQKRKRIKSKPYLEWVATLPCAACEIRDGTVVAHHWKGEGGHLSGGMGLKASDWLTMPLCHKCHSQIHSGDAALISWQREYILRTLDIAFNSGIIEI